MFFEEIHQENKNVLAKGFLPTNCLRYPYTKYVNKKQVKLNLDHSPYRLLLDMPDFFIYRHKKP